MQHRRGDRTVVLEAHPWRAGGEHELEREARAEGRHQHGLAVDGHDPLAPAHLLLDQVGEHVGAHCASGVGAEALALARDQRGDEVERVQLRMGVSERCPGFGTLADYQVQAGRLGVGAHPCPPRLHRDRHLIYRQLGEGGDRIGRVDDHLVRAACGTGPE